MPFKPVLDAWRHTAVATHPLTQVRCSAVDLGKREGILTDARRGGRILWYYGREMPGLGKKILVVDDDDFLRSMFDAVFKQEGFEVRTANDGQEAWDAIGSGFVPDIVFTGIIMPRMTGFDLVRKMQADPKLASIPVAISSHRGREEDKKTAKELNADDFLIKGAVPVVEVVRRIEYLLGIHKTYKIKLDRATADTEALIELLNKQQQTSCGSFGGKDIYLEFTPEKETGEFGVKLTDEPS